MTKKTIEELLEENEVTLSGEILTLNSNLSSGIKLYLTDKLPDTEITRIVINPLDKCYIISNDKIQLKEIVVKSSTNLYLRNIPDDCKIIVKEKVKLYLLTNTNENNRLTLADPIELGPTEGE